MDRKRKSQFLAQKQKIRSTKSEARSSKQIQNDEKHDNYNAPNGKDEFTVLDFLILDLFWPRFVSDFVLRISDFDLGFVSDRGASFEIRISDLSF